MSFDIIDVEFCLGSNKINLYKDFDSNTKEKFTKKTGIPNVYHSNDDEDVISLSFKSIKKLFKKRKIDPKEIDLLIFVTQTNPFFLPSASAIIQNQLNLREDCICLDINLGCSGFIYALSIVNSYFINSNYSNALVVCSDTYSKFIDKNDKSTYLLFSDASSCTLLKKRKKDPFNFILKTDGSGFDKLICANNLTNNKSSYLKMIGSDIYQFTMSEIPKIILEILKINKLDINHIDYFLFHQASQIVLESLIRKLDIHKEKVPTNYQIFGNTVSSTIPILIYDMIANGNINNSKLCLSGFGVGLSWGSFIYE